jgi:thiol-disulfide isomerase/thioredoxin
MSTIIRRILLLLALTFLSPSLFSQKHYHLTVKLPQGVNPEKMEAWLDNGKDVKQITPQSVGQNQLVFTGNYYSLYAAITLQNSPGMQTTRFAHTFFVQQKPGIITFQESGSPTYTFQNYALQNVFDFKEEQKQLQEYTTAEREKAIHYERQYGDQIFSGNDTTVRNHYLKVLMPALRRKKLDYIIKHPGSYYSFFTFRADVARTGVLPADSLLVVFNSFPGAFKYSDEGNYLNAFLHGRSAGQKGTAINFVAKDINKNTVSLSQFKSKKCVLLHFWATWCTPCMKELPALKEISNEYNLKELQIISIALPSAKYSDYLTAIKNFKMNWVHLYNNPDLVNKYGNEPIPRLCLIDKTGKLVYDQIGLGEKDDVQLLQLREKLAEISQGD